LAQRFGVSVGYVAKIRGQRRRSGKMERVPHHPGRKPKFTAPIRERLRRWLGQQPDLTLAELQQALRQQEQLPVSSPALWKVLRVMGLRLKKSRSTPANATRKRTASGARNSSPPSLRSHRRS